MTSNQIAYRQAREAERSNREKESETKRSNKAKEKETMRHNERTEGQKDMEILTNTVGNLTKLVGSANDPVWYNRDPQLVKDVASISYHTPLGNTFTNEFSSSVKMPGLTVLSFIPSIGNTGGNSVENNVCNVAAKNIYGFVRYANSGARNYEATDLMMYLLAMDQVYSYWSHLRRIYSLALTYKGANRYYSNAMLQACGVNPLDIRMHLSNLRAYINSFALRANAFYVPKSLPYYQRHIWLNHNIFKDMPIKKSQEYLFLQEAFLLYDDINGQLSTNVQVSDDEFQSAARFLPNSHYDYDQLALIGDQLLERLVISEDIGIMSGDILKAYGESNMFYLPSTEENFHIESVYSPEVLSQIQASTLVQVVDDNVAWDKGSFGIHQDSDGHIYQGIPFYMTSQEGSAVQGYGVPVGMGRLPESTITTNDEETDTVTTIGNSDFVHTPVMQVHTINMYKDDITPDDNMVATRLVSNIDTTGAKFWSNVSTDPWYNHKADVVSACGTEIVSRATIIRLNTDGETSIYKRVYFVNIVSNTITSVELLSTTMKFDWFPIYYASSNINTIVGERAILDCANYALVSYQNIANMHYVATLSEFGVPDLGVKVRTR